MGERLQLIDKWETGSDTTLKKYSMTTDIHTDKANKKDGPFIFPDSHSANRYDSYDDARFNLSVTHQEPKITRTYDGWETTTTDTVNLGMCPDDYRMSWIGAKNVTATVGEVTIETSFYYPPEPRGVTGGYTAALVKWDKTTIRGLTTTPIVLTGYYSQSFNPEHHNFDEHFLFEPTLEEGISTDIIDELKTKNIRYIYMKSGYDSSEIFLIDFEGKPTEIKDL